MVPTSCQRCRQNFKSDAALQAHIRDTVMHNVCPICSYDFPTALGLTQHFVFGPTPSYCVLCGQQFVTYCSMIKHYKAVPHHRCTSCSSVFFSEIELQEHYSADHWYCLSCKYIFESEKDLIMHLRSLHGDCYCEACDFVFSSEARMHDHYRKEHPYCTGCRRMFKNQDALNIHLQSSVHQWRCELCSTSLHSEVDLHEHNRKNHVYCSDCKVVFGDEKALENHLKTSVVHILCCDLCSTVFSSKEELHDHYADEHMYCGDCKRVFRGKIDLRTHLRSSHHNARTVHCPGHDRKKSCQKSFLSGAGLINHLESGACPSHMNRHHVNRLAVELDSNNTLTNASRLLTGPGGSRVPPLIAAPSRATSLSWNGSKFECVLCHKEFSHLERLNQHLNSPAHDEEIYKCPRGWQGCGTEFRTLSALCQHVESEQCGVHRFNKTVQEMVGSLTSDMHRLTM